MVIHCVTFQVYELADNLKRDNRYLNWTQTGIKKECKRLHSSVHEVDLLVTSLEQKMAAKEAVAANAPFDELVSKVPMGSDEDVVVVLRTTKLSNALFAKVYVYMDDIHHTALYLKVIPYPFLRL